MYDDFGAGRLYAVERILSAGNDGAVSIFIVAYESVVEVDGDGWTTQRGPPVGRAFATKAS